MQQASMVVEWHGCGSGGDKGSCGGWIGGVLQLSGGGWGALANPGGSTRLYSSTHRWYSDP